MSKIKQENRQVSCTKILRIVNSNQKLLKTHEILNHFHHLEYKNCSTDWGFGNKTNFQIGIQIDVLRVLP